MFIRFTRDYQAGNGRMYQGGEVIDVDKVWGNTLIAEGAATLNTSGDAGVVTLSPDGKSLVGPDGSYFPVIENSGLIGTLAVLGDSRGALGYAFTADGRCQSTIPRAALNWLNFYLGGPWKYVQTSVFSVAGERTDEWEDGHQAILALTTRPDYVYITFPTNDPQQGIDAAVTIANMERFVKAHAARGSRIILQTAGSNNANTTLKWTKIKRINDWIKATAATIGAYVIDTLTPTADPATGLFYTGYGYDGTHENALAAQKQAVFNAPKFLAQARLASRMAKANLWETAAFNGAMAGNVANIPTGWTSTGTAGTRTKQARSDIPGEFARVAFTSASDTEESGIYQAFNFNTAWATGSKALGVRVKGSFGDHWVCTTAGTSSGTEPAAMATASNPGDVVTDSGGVVWTRIATIVPGVSRITVLAEMQVSGTGGHQPRIQCTFGGTADQMSLFRSMSPNAADVSPPIAVVASDIVPVLTTPTVLVPADATSLSMYITCRAANGVAVTVDIGRVVIEVE